MMKIIHPEVGSHIHYPANVLVVQNEVPLLGMSVTSPVVDEKSWLVSAITDLLQWLGDHDLFGDQPGDQQVTGVQIAGETAIPLHQDCSPQSPAFEPYYFAFPETFFEQLNWRSP